MNQSRLPDLEIDLLRAFIAVANSGSFTAAADAINRSQSAVSQKILRLEERLGCRVFERTSRSLLLTQAGEHLAGYAQRILELNDAAMRGITRPALGGNIRLGISEDFIPGQLPALLSRFSRLHPGVHLALKTGLSCDLLQAYDEGELDVVIAKKDRSAQRGRVIWREPLVWMCAADFELDPQAPLPLVLLRSPCTYRQLMLEALSARGQDWNIVCTASSLMSVQAAVAGGLGLTVLGRSFMQAGMRTWQTPSGWAPLPKTEITVIGEESADSEIVTPLVDFLTEYLAAGRAQASLPS
ncbi:LysR substrate-binding domain-containing protein [Bordetella trematum]|uniref:LysR substrate-binding domain-containing protein n=1 Tax=Bordetella trematum TaxID=123899 RepID=UPI000D81FD89|nr:LysR substrate-binding domain-containing protein [Bordetella trematum]SPU49302.1 LysR family transcriptional regulator [Bordetella trematum]VDH03772.1 HTH-type transcriptional regulator YofA [Bordetella trematum]